LNHIFLGAVVFGTTLLVASFLLGGKDTDHPGGGHAHADHGFAWGWAPVTSLRFWIFLFAFGGAVGYALLALGESDAIAIAGAVVVGWASGVLAVAILSALGRRQVSSEVDAKELVGTTGHLVLPASPEQPGKVRVEVKGRTEDFVANVVDDGGALATGTQVLIVAEGERGSLLVAKHEV
jgi:membrane protein implicated in regulation of membrane protease activity